MTSAVLAAFRRVLPDREIAVVDLAPTIPEAVIEARGDRGVGGRLSLAGPGDRILHLAADLVPPRLTGRDEAGVLATARENMKRIETLLRDPELRQRPVVLVNDVSLYLQAGRPEDLMARLGASRTLVVNGYYGRALGSGELSRREAGQMRILMNYFDRLIHLRRPKRPGPDMKEDLK